MITIAYAGRDGREDPSFVKGKTPSLTSPSYAEKISTHNIRLEVDDTYKKDSESESLHSFGGFQLGYQITAGQNVRLAIKITNISQKVTPNIKIFYEIFGRTRDSGTTSSVKVGDRFIEDQGEFELKEPLKFNESRIFLTRPTRFSYSREMHRFSNSQGYWVKGEKYNGYRVRVYDENNILLATKKK